MVMVFIILQCNGAFFSEHLLASIKSIHYLASSLPLNKVRIPTVVVGTPIIVTPY